MGVEFGSSAEPFALFEKKITVQDESTESSCSIEHVPPIDALWAKVQTMDMMRFIPLI